MSPRASGPHVRVLSGHGPEMGIRSRGVMRLGPLLISSRGWDASWVPWSCCEIFADRLSGDGRGSSGTAGEAEIRGGLVARVVVAGGPGIAADAAALQRLHRTPPYGTD